MRRYGIHRLTEMFPWQEGWEDTFDTEKQLIIGEMASAGLQGMVYHIGSTSVKGMSSKPIIDILLCPEEGCELESFIPVLENAGYTNLWECGRVGRYFFSKGDEEHKTFYLHLCYEGHQVALDQKLFQFIERNDPIVFSSYMHLKQALAILFPVDREEYRSVKSMYIDGVLSAYRLGERTLADKILSEMDAIEDGKQIKYWIYEFEMSEERKQEFDAVCALHELTPDEFFEAAIKDAIRAAQADPEVQR